MKNSLRALLKYGLTEYHVTKSDIMEYSLCKMNVLNLLRYPRYLMLIKEKYGNTAESIIEEILQSGSITATCIIFNIVSKSKNDSVRNCFQIYNIFLVVNLISLYYYRKTVAK